ncbi:MAG: sigma factor, partial [Gemmatimonadota bacterium]
MTTALIPTLLAPATSSPPRRMMSEAERTDRAREHQLVLAAQSGENEAFAALVRLHQRRAYAVARSIVLTHEDAEDAVQEGFLHAYR